VIKSGDNAGECSAHTGIARLKKRETFGTRKIPTLLRKARQGWGTHESPYESPSWRNLLLYRVPGLQDEFDIALMVQAHGAVEVYLLQR
jgi:hypothetical protein